MVSLTQVLRESDLTDADREPEPLPTIWQVSDDLWRVVEPLLTELDPPKGVGRTRIDPRRALDGILYRVRTGCQWQALPAAFGDDSSVHRTMQRWEGQGVFFRLWATLVDGCAEIGGVDWAWQSADGAMGKARKKGI